MSKNYTFSDCIEYAYRHNITFTFETNYNDNSSDIFSYISDAADGYLTATLCFFTWNYFNHKWEYNIDLNVRYAYDKDYELCRRLCIALNTHSETHTHVHPYHTDRIWYGPLGNTNLNYHNIAASTVEGDIAWS